MFQRRSIRLIAPALLALLLGACSDDPASPATDGASISDYVASVSFDDTPATLQTSSIPRPTTEGPTITVNGHVTIVNGGTATVTVTSATAFSTVYVAGSAPISGLFMPVGGYYEVTLPVAVTSADVLLTFPQSLPSGDIDLYFSVKDPAGHVGTVAGRTFDALIVGTGDVQVTVAWDTDADVDLHVVDPAGQEIYWAVRQSFSGGELDLDSNAACNTDGVRNENVTWGVGAAPVGSYTVRVDYWSSCSASATNYTVLINNGGDIEIYRGTFTGSGDQGSAGSGIEIATFTRTSGPAAAPVPSRSIPNRPPGHK